ncbi:hypothetical protein GQ457_10G005630 [Hibiscus cannabinus]
MRFMYCVAVILRRGDLQNRYDAAVTLRCGRILILCSQQVSIRSSSDRSGHVRPPAESSRRPFSRYRLVFPRRSPELDEKGPRLPLVDLGGLRICGSLHRDDSIHRWESSENAPPPRPFLISFLFWVFCVTDLGCLVFDLLSLMRA